MGMRQAWGIVGRRRLLRGSVVALERFWAAVQAFADRLLFHRILLEWTRATNSG